MKTVDFAKEGISANELVIDNEGCATIINCRNKSGEYGLRDCNGSLFMYDEMHDECHVCHKVIRFTDNGMPVCESGKDEFGYEQMEIKCVDNVPYVKPLVVLNSHILSCNDVSTGITSTSVVADGGCKYGACIEFILQPPATDDNNIAVVKRCWAYEAMGLYDNVCCHHEQRINESLMKNK